MTTFSEKARAVILDAKLAFPGEWECMPGLGIRTYGDSDDDQEMQYCPLTAALYRRTGRKYRVADALYAGTMEMGLSAVDTVCIMEAADNYDDPLRPELLQLLGVME